MSRVTVSIARLGWLSATLLLTVGLLAMSGVRADAHGDPTLPLLSEPLATLSATRGEGPRTAPEFDAIPDSRADGPFVARERSERLPLSCSPGFYTSLSPCTNSATVAPSSTTTRTYQVTNGNDRSARIELRCTKGGAVTACSVSPTRVDVPAGESRSLTLTFTVSSSGSGSVVVRAIDLTMGDDASAILNVTVQAPSNAPAVTPDGATLSASPGASSDYQFSVRNTGSTTATYTITRTCSTGITCGLPSVSSIQLAGGATGSVSVPYTSGARGTSGSITLTARLSTNTAVTDNGSVTISVPHVYTVSVTPDGDNMQVVAGSTYQLGFSIANQGSAAATYAISRTCVGLALCELSATSLTVPAGSSGSVNVQVAAGEDGTTGSVAVTAEYSGYTDTGTRTTTSVAPCSAGVIQIAPCGGGPVAVVPPGATGQSATFTVSNLSTTDQYLFNVQCATTGALSGCSTSPGLDVSPGQSRSVTVTYSSGASTGAGTLRLVLRGDAHVAGSIQAAVVSPPVIAAGAPVLTRVEAGQQQSQRFTISNGSSLAATFNIAAACTGHAVPVSGTTCAPSSTQVTIAAGASASVDVAYKGGEPAETGRVSITATHAANASIRSSGSVDVTVSRRELLVTPRDIAYWANASASLAQTYWVKNRGNVEVDVALTKACTGPGVQAQCTSSASSAHLGVGDSTAVTLSFTTTSLADSSGQLRLRATVTGIASIVGDSATTTVRLKPAPGPLVVVGPTNVIDRSQCLTMAAGEGAAYECADLRLVHALPMVRTLNKVRAPTLIYNSRHATRAVILAADVTPDATLGKPVQVTATVKTRPAGAPVQATTRALNIPFRVAAWQAGEQRRIGVTFEEPGPTGLYEYELDVMIRYASTTQHHIATGRFILVSRRESEFGAGWWLAGLERVYTTADPQSLLWVGGDGSAREYRLVPGTGNVWAAPAVDRPDTLERNADGTYVRHAPNGIRVHFSAAGLHESTVNRLSHVTRFAYGGPSGTRLESITVPGWVSGPAYTFVYTGEMLDSVIALPVNGETRALKLTHNADLDPGTPLVRTLATIRDPDSTATSPDPVVRFEPDPGQPLRILRRFDRRGMRVRFEYWRGDVVAKIAGPVDPTVTGAPEPVTNITPAEWLGVSLPSDSASPPKPTQYLTYVNGPRPDAEAVDTTRFHIGAYGGVTKISNALGQVTVVSRDDPRWPALVTKTVKPNGHTTFATYDARGNLSSVTDSSIVVNGARPTTIYEWDHTFDVVTRIIQPLGQTTVFEIEPTNGNRTAQQVGPTRRHRTEFRYYDSGVYAGLVRATQTAGTGADTVVYDPATGNVIGTATALSHWTTYLSDEIGRVTEVTLAVDSLDRTRLGSSTYPRRRSVTVYDLAGQPIEERTISNADQLIVTKTYDFEGNLKSLTREASPQRTEIASLTTQWVHDPAGRVLEVIAPDGAVDRYEYDLAGNQRYWTTRRDSVVSMEYDELSRLKRRIVPSMGYGEETVTLYHYQFTFPAINTTCPTESTHALCTPADTATFTYDNVGNLKTANNRFAQIGRGYHPDGTLYTDTLRIRTYRSLVESGNFTDHVYVMGREYDLNRRVRRLTAPPNLAGSASLGYRGYVDYEYDDETGVLRRVIDLMGEEFRFSYDSALRADSITYPGELYEKLAFDAAGRVKRRVETGFGDNPIGAFRDDVINWSADGRILSVDDAGDAIASNTYALLGHLTAFELPLYCGPNTLKSEQTWAKDGLGNDVETYTRTPACPYNIPRFSSETRRATYHYNPASGRLEAVDDITNGTATRIETRSYDAAGNEIGLRRGEYDNAQAVYYKAALNSYFGGDNKLYFTHKHTASANDLGGDQASDRGAFEEFRYDALGRRVLRRSEKWCNEMPGCRAELERTVWDGSQIIAEIRKPGEWSEVNTLGESDGTYNAQSYDGYYNRVLYTHSAGIDAPLSVTRLDFGGGFPRAFVVVPHRNWRGIPDAGSFADGRLELVSSEGIELGIRWPAENMLAYQSFRQDHSRGMFMGSLISLNGDMNGLRYMRNRYYDAASGRFTQEDPVGLAGGINLYGFAAGDPISFGDPFGLNAECGEHPLPPCPNSEADGSQPAHSQPTASSVAQHSETIDQVAAESGVDARLIRAIMYVETTQGWYDSFFALLDVNKSVLPMNINTSVWAGRLGYTRDQLKNPATNIRAGAAILKQISESMPGASIAQIATRYNKRSAAQVTDYGARVEQVYREQAWLNVPCGAACDIGGPE